MHIVIFKNRLRDVTTENEAELNLRIKTLEQENYELEELRCRSLFII